MKFALPVKTIEIIDREKAGVMVRNARTKANISLRELAKRMKITAPYLSDMELGRRCFTPHRFASAMSFIKSHKP